MASRKTELQPTDTKRPTAVVPWGNDDAKERLLAGGILTTYNIEEREGQIALFRAVMAADEQCERMVGEVVEVSHVVAHMRDLIDADTGEVSRVCRTVMVGPDGKRISTGSNSVARSLVQAAEILGVSPPWNPPLRFKVVKQRPVKGKHDYLILELIP